MQINEVADVLDEVDSSDDDEVDSSDDEEVYSSNDDEVDSWVEGTDTNAEEKIEEFDSEVECSDTESDTIDEVEEIDKSYAYDDKGRKYRAIHVYKWVTKNGVAVKEYAGNIFDWFVYVNFVEVCNIGWQMYAMNARQEN